jgi:hypothetical protein
MTFEALGSHAKMAQLLRCDADKQRRMKKMNGLLYRHSLAQRQRT